jgi:hypothetical protein
VTYSAASSFWNCRLYRSVLSGAVPITDSCLSSSSSHIVPDGQSACSSWCRAPCSAITHWLDWRRTHNHILLSHLRLPQPGRPGPTSYIPQEQGCPNIPPSTGFPFHRLLRLATRMTPALKLKQRYDWRSVSQYVLVSIPLWDLRPDFNSVWKLLSCLCGAPSLTRGRACLRGRPNRNHGSPMFLLLSVIMEMLVDSSCPW